MYQLTTYAIKTKAERNHINHNISEPQIYLRNLKHRTPFHRRLSKTLQDLNTPLPPIQNEIIDKYFTPWLYNPKTINSEEWTIPKVRNLLPDFEIIYTDGSVSEKGAGCAFVHLANSYLFGLPKTTSSFSAEIYAVLKALDHIKNAETNKFIIATDCRSLVSSIHNTNHPHVLIQHIQYKHEKIKHSKTVKFLWIKGHNGTPGNEKADQAAKSAIHLPAITQKIIKHDAILHLKRKIQNKWTLEWQNTPFLNKLRQIKNTTAPLASSYRTSRWEEVALCRLRIGHTRATHSYIMAKEDPPKCPGCNDILTVKHWITDCPATRDTFTEIPNSLLEILTEEKHITAVLQKIKSTNFAI